MTACLSNQPCIRGLRFCWQAVPHAQGMFLPHLGTYIQSGPASLRRYGGGAVLNTDKSAMLPQRKPNR